MKRTMLVLALTVLTCAGCRAVSPYGDPGCCEPVGAECGDPCADECCNGRGGNLANSGLCGGVCQGGGDCAVFSRYCGQRCEPGGCAGCCAGACGGCGCGCGAGACGDGYPAGQYDCSPCDSPDWGCNGYRHPHGYVTGHECMCGDPNCTHPPGPKFAPCGNGYCCCCCGQPAPGCCCCNSGDQHYNFAPGPPVAQTAYPYYTLRGPRDFFLNNPPSIGPY